MKIKIHLGIWTFLSFICKSIVKKDSSIKLTPPQFLRKILRFSEISCKCISFVNLIPKTTLG